jgi:hypothetical protein
VQDSEQMIDALICAVLRGEEPRFPASLSACTFMKQVRFHGAHGLLHHQGLGRDWPTLVLSDIHDNAVHLAMWELRHQQVLEQTLEVLHHAGIAPVLFKGTALAYSVYADPALRSRSDTDLIIPSSKRALAHEVLTSFGFQRDEGVSGDLVSYQATYILEAKHGVTHALDLHWRINNSEVLAQLFDYEELKRNARALPAISPLALGASPAHALLLACMHRATHKQNPYYVDGDPHYTADRLVWLYDIHLLAREFTPDDWQLFADLAVNKGLAGICLQGLEGARASFGSCYPARIADSLQRPVDGDRATHYLHSSKVRQQWMDFCALGSASRQLKFIGELLFPPVTYIRSKYRQSAAWVPWLYLKRIGCGMLKNLIRR